MKTGRMATKAMLALLGLASCNFDAAFKRYCDNNPHCQADAGSASDVGPDIGPDAGLEVGPDAGPDSAVNDAEFWPAIPSPKPCASSSDCSGPDEVCHPFSQVCVRTCNSLADCQPWPWLGSCSDPRGGGPSRGQKICSCTALSCNSYASGFVCDSDGSCKPICKSDQDCLGFPLPRACDLPTGLCKLIPQPCSVSTDCPPMQPRCDPTSLVCTGCVSSADCAGRPDGVSLQCGPTGGCVGPQSGP